MFRWKFLLPVYCNWSIRFVFCQYLHEAFSDFIRAPLQFWLASFPLELCSFPVVHSSPSLRNCSSVGLVHRRWYIESHVEAFFRKILFHYLVLRGMFLVTVNITRGFWATSTCTQISACEILHDLLMKVHYTPLTERAFNLSFEILS